MHNRTARLAATAAPAAIALSLALLLAACSSHPPGAAEPADAPSGGAAPAGTVRQVGPDPQGIVYDPGTGTVAVAVQGPDRLLLLDPTTLAVRRSVALPGSVRHLQLARPGGPVLVPAESAAELVQVPLTGSTSPVITKVGAQPHDATRSGDDVVVGNEFGQSLSVIRGGRVVRTLTGVKQPGGVIGDGSTVAVVDVAHFTVSTYDLGSGRRTAVVPAGAGPTHGVLISGNRLAVTDTRGNALLLFALSPLHESARLALPGTPYGLSVDRSTDTVWVTLTARNEVVGIDTSGVRPRVVARYPTVEQPDTVAVAPGSHVVWVTGTRAGQVERITR